jgi:predicted PurR-regulated permease PerM
VAHDLREQPWGVALRQELCGCLSHYGAVSNQAASSTHEPRAGRIANGDVARICLIATAILALAAVVWIAADVIVLAFGGIVVAAVLRSLAAPIGRALRLPDKWAVIVAVVALLVAVGLLTWFFGDRMAEQVHGLKTQLPQALAKVQEWLGKWKTGRMFLDSLEQAPDGAKILSGATKLAGITVGLLGNALLIVFVGIYFALAPDLYVRGVVALCPAKRRPLVREALVAAGEALRKWLIGQLAVMVVVGTLTGLGLWAIGVESAFVLGVLAGLLEFVPLIGPIVSAIPGALLAALNGPNVMLYALGIYIAVQQLEGILATPIAQRWSVKLPPALTLLSLVAVGLVFGTLGLLFATPMAVAAMVLVQKLYVDRLKER